MAMDSDFSLPQAERSARQAAGHWILARAGKRVLRPGGLRLTVRMLHAAHIQDKSVVEFAPGLGRTAKLIVSSGVGTYTAVEQDPAAAKRVESIVAACRGKVIRAKAQESGLPDACADVVVGEAMLTMQGEKTKEQIVSEAYRLLKPGGCYALHELAVTPEEIDPEFAADLRRQLAETIRVNARPLTAREWGALLENAGFTVDWHAAAPMALLSVKRNIADEGILGVLKIMRNLLRDRELRARVLQMRALFRRYRRSLEGIAIVARKPQE